MRRYTCIYIFLWYDVTQGAAASATHTQGVDCVSDEYGNDYVTITDEDGNEFELEHLDTVEQGGRIYMAFLPADMDEDDEDFGLVILRVSNKDGEEVLVTLDDDDELEKIFECFIERLTDELDDIADDEADGDIDNDLDGEDE